MRHYPVLNPIQIDGHVKRSGTVQLSDTDGALLMLQGFVGAPVDGTTEAADPPPAPGNETGATTDTTPESDGASGAVDSAGSAQGTEAAASGGGESPAAAPARGRKKR